MLSMLLSAAMPGFIFYLERKKVMIKEDLSLFTDGKETSESEVATVIQVIDDAVIFKDNDGGLFFLSADPDAFEIGTVAAKSGLIPIDSADDSVKEKILSALGKEGK